VRLRATAGLGGPVVMNSIAKRLTEELL